MQEKHAIPTESSVALLKELHILTRDGRLNQDSRRKLKQVNHLIGFIGPLINEIKSKQAEVRLADIGAGKSYLGFLLYDRFARNGAGAIAVHGIETRAELVERSVALAARLGFGGMRFHRLDAASAHEAGELPARIDIVTALHACDTATDDAIRFALQCKAPLIVLAPCCQAEVAALLRRNKQKALADPLAELWRHPLHTREFGSHVTNVLRCLQLQAHGYEVSVTELVGWEHSMKNELIVARQENRPGRVPAERLQALLSQLGLEGLRERFFIPGGDAIQNANQTQGAHAP
ncbi:MAG: SAM-dependent methyltransferase [Sulfuritalea sp.]|nr:SAM-dependent methyltransferase [Sulfuritalea sp.]